MVLGLLYWVFVVGCLVNSSMFLLVVISFSCGMVFLWLRLMVGLLLSCCIMV